MKMTLKEPVRVKTKGYSVCSLFPALALGVRRVWFLLAANDCILAMKGVDICNWQFIPGSYTCPPNVNDVFRIGWSAGILYFLSGQPIGSVDMCRASNTCGTWDLGPDLDRCPLPCPCTPTPPSTISYENHDIAIAMSHSRADPVLPLLGVFIYLNQCHCPGWGYLNIYISVTALAGGI